MRIRISLSKPGLFLSKENFRQARGNKHAGTVVMDPEDFLRLCVTDQREYDRIVGEARTLDEYNAYTKSGNAIHLPWLYLSLDGIQYRDERPTMLKGTIVGHEGRHRAAALIKAGVTKMPVSLRLYLKGVERQYKPTEEDPWGKAKWTKADLPTTIFGEYSDFSARLNVNTFKPY